MDKNRKHHLNNKINEYSFVKQVSKAQISSQLRDEIILSIGINQINSLDHLIEWLIYLRSN